MATSRRRRRGGLDRVAPVRARRRRRARRQQAVEANKAGLPQPGSPARLAFETFTLWDARWYLEIVRQGYPHSIPPDVTYFQDPRPAPPSSPLYPMTVRALDAVLPGGDIVRRARRSTSSSASPGC